MARQSAVAPKPTEPVPQPGKRVAIWLRVSTEDQAKGESPQHHEQRARYYAEGKGWDVIKAYDLSGVSGKSVKDHPLAKQMIADIRSKEITGLIFSKVARLARNTKELLEFADIFQKEGADLISLQESIDTSTPAGRMFYTMQAALAQWEREEIAERVAASVSVRAKLGKNTGGSAPFGYQWLDGKLVPDPKEVPVRRLLYELFREHRRLKKVARLLNEAGYRTRKGNKFTDTSTRRNLEDPTAKGRHRANYTRSRGDGCAWDLKKEEEWVWTDVEPIVSVELWQECNQLLAERTVRRPGKPVVHLFSGVTFCACGFKMYVPSNLPKYYCYKCHTKIPVDDLETVFVEQLRGFFLDENEVAQYLAQSDTVLEEKRLLIGTISAERGQIAAEQEKLYQLYLAGGLSVEGFRQRNQPLEERLAQVSAELPRLQADVDLLTINHLSGAQMVSEAQSLYAQWPDLPFEEKRTVVENVVERITVDKNRQEVTVDLAYLPAGGPPPAGSPETGTNKQRNLIPALPFCKLRFAAPLLPPLNYQRVPQTLAEHLLRRRLDLHLLQREVAKEMGVSTAAYRLWERSKETPRIPFWKQVIEFLGCDPVTVEDTWPAKILAVRRRLGWTQEQFAKHLKRDPATLSRWETGERTPWRCDRQALWDLFVQVGLPPPTAEEVAKVRLCKRWRFLYPEWAARQGR